MMLLLIVVTLVAVPACVIRAFGVTPTNLGSMSDQWLCEYRASHES